MTDRPVAFSAPMVCTLIAGRKTQTRRLDTSPLRRASAGDRLWVREEWRSSVAYDDLKPSDMGGEEPIMFDADGSTERWTRGTAKPGRRRAPMHMPRWASRLTLIVEEVRVERLQEITEADAVAEGVAWSEPTDADREWARAHAEENGGDGSIEGVWTVPGLPSIKGLPADVWHVSAPLCYGRLWDMLHTADGQRWADNPWIVALTFRVVRGNIDQVPA